MQDTDKNIHNDNKKVLEQLQQSEHSIDEKDMTSKMEHGNASAEDLDAFKAYTDKLEKETEQDTKRLRKRNIVVAIIAAVVIAAGAGGFYYYRIKQKANFTDVVDSYYGYLEKGQLSNAVDLDAMNIKDETSMAEVGSLYKTVIEDGEAVYGDKYIEEFKDYIASTVRKNYQSHRIENVRISDDKKKATIDAVVDGNSYSMMTYTGTSEITKYTAQLANGKYKSQMDAIRKSKDGNDVKLAKMRNIVASDIFRKMAADRDKNNTMVLNQFKITVVKQSDGSYKISKIAYKNSGKIDGTRRDFKETKKKTKKQDAKAEAKKGNSTASAQSKSKTKAQ